MNSPGKIGFDDDGQPVGVTDFDYDALDREAERIDHAKDIAYLKDKQRELLRLIFEAITGNAKGATEAGRNAWILGFLLKQTTLKTQTELGQKLGLTKGRTSQLLNQFLEINPMLARLLRR